MKDLIDERDHIFNKVGLTQKEPIDLNDAYVALDVEIGYDNLNVLEIIEADDTKDTWLYTQPLVTPFHVKNIIEATTELQMLTITPNNFPNVTSV